MTNEPIETEVLPENAIALRPSMAVSHALGVNEIVAQVKLIQDVMHKVMKEGEHYGKVPGCGDKKTLLQPGAQKLTMTFRLAPAYEIQEVNLERGHKEYRVICTLKSMGNGSFVGQGVGCCSSMESKYRFRNSNKHCPSCGKETVLKSKKDNGWFCWVKKGGCGENFAQGSPVAMLIDAQEAGKVENENPADTFNTVLKMAKKRAFVDATITATAASDIFTQDVGDDESETPENPPQQPAVSPQTRQSAGKVQSTSPPQQNAPQGKSDKEATEKTRAWAIEELKAGPKDAHRDIVTDYLRKAGVLMANEEIEEWPLTRVPTTRGQLREILPLLGGFEAGEPAIYPTWGAPTEPPKAKKANPAEHKAEIERVSVKSGKKKDGQPWSLYGVKLDGVWHSTFDTRIGEYCKENKGQVITFFFTQNEKGRTLERVIEAEDADSIAPVAEEDQLPF